MAPVALFEALSGYPTDENYPRHLVGTQYEHQVFVLSMNLLVLTTEQRDSVNQHGVDVGGTNDDVQPIRGGRRKKSHLPSLSVGNRYTSFLSLCD